MTESIGYSKELAAAMRRAYDAGSLTMDAVDEIVNELDSVAGQNCYGATLLRFLLHDLRCEFPLPDKEDPPRGEYTPPDYDLHWG